MLNKIMLIGNLGKDPELSVTNDGTPVTKFSLAVSRKYKAQTGETKEETEWFNIVTWNKLADVTRKYPLETVYLLRYFPINRSTVVKSERRKQYPKNWEHLARQCKEQAGKQCEHCQITQGKQRISKRSGKRYVVFLHAAHRDHDLSNPAPVLLCLCPTCRGRYDYRHRMQQHRLNHERLKHRLLLSYS